MKKIGEFYKVKDRNGGHPAQIYKINIENSEYYIVRFSHQDRKDRIKLTHNIDPDSLDDCFIIKNPQIVPYSDLKQIQNTRILEYIPTMMILFKKLKIKNDTHESPKHLFAECHWNY